MTRINIGIPPQVLDDWRLIAEINETPRVAEVYQNRIDKNMNFGDIPKQFTLGEGHVKFFLNKGSCLINRYNAIVDEYETRGLKKIYGLHDKQCKPDITPLFVFKKEHFNDYEISQKDIDLLVTRIIDTINESDKQPYWYGNVQTKKEAINKLLKIGSYIKKPEQLNLF